KGRRLGEVASGARTTGAGALSLGAGAALLGVLPLVQMLAGLRGGGLPQGIDQLALALALAAPALLAVGREGIPGGLGVLSAAGACVAGTIALGFRPYDVGTALAGAALLALWLQPALNGRTEATVWLVLGAPAL